VKAEDLAAAIVNETIPRWGQDMSNAEKWSVVISVIYAPEEGADMEEFIEPDPSVLLNRVDYASAYAEDEEEALEAHVLLADLQNDIFWALMANKVGDAAENERRYHESFVWWRKLKDKADALEVGEEEWKHDWIH